MTADRLYFLEPSWQHNPKGPDGQGWNRLAIIPIEPSPRCSMRPRTRQAALDTLRGMARFGIITAYDVCTGQGNCAGCSVACDPKSPWPETGKVRDKSDYLVVDIDGQSSCFDNWRQLLKAYDLPMLSRHIDDTGMYWSMAQ